MSDFSHETMAEMPVGVVEEVVLMMAVAEKMHMVVEQVQTPTMIETIGAVIAAAAEWQIRAKVAPTVILTRSLLHQGLAAGIQILQPKIWWIIEGVALVRHDRRESRKCIVKNA